MFIRCLKDYSHEPVLLNTRHISDIYESSDLDGKVCVFVVTVQRIAKQTGMGRYYIPGETLESVRSRLSAAHQLIK